MIKLCNKKDVTDYLSCICDVMNQEAILKDNWDYHRKAVDKIKSNDKANKVYIPTHSPLKPTWNEKEYIKKAEGSTITGKAWDKVAGIGGALCLTGIGLPIGLILLAIGFVLWLSRNSGIKKAAKDLYEKELSEYRSLERRIYDKETVNTQYEVLKSRIDTRCLSDIYSKYSKMRYDLFSLNIIPKEYQKIDTVIMIRYYMMENGIDTIEKAIEKYEDELFKGNIQSGIDTIYKNKRYLAVSMRPVLEVLDKRYQKIKMIIENCEAEIEAVIESKNISSFNIANTYLYRYAHDALETSEALYNKLNRE